MSKFRPELSMLMLFGAHLWKYMQGQYWPSHLTDVTETTSHNENILQCLLNSSALQETSQRMIFSPPTSRHSQNKNSANVEKRTRLLVSSSSEIYHHYSAIVLLLAVIGKWMGRHVSVKRKRSDTDKEMEKEGKEKRKKTKNKRSRGEEEKDEIGNRSYHKII